ncbi:MAG: alpha/beta hydrolase-fold protein [Candidatus Acidiferrum sp.]
MRISWLSCLLFLALASRATGRPQETGFLDRTVSLHGTSYKYQVFLPDNWSRKQKWPITLFLHGAGERGSDGLLQTEVGLPRAIRENRSRFPTVVVIPQCLTDQWWTTPEMEEMALAALAATTKEFNGDTKRTYLTGLSMGGFGSWDLAARYPGKFAAVMPICGGIVLPEHLRQMHPDMAKNGYANDPKSYGEVAKKIGKTPVWIFHGGADDTVPVDGSRKMNDALKAAGGNVRYTEYPGVGHNSWDKAYAEPELMTWLLSKSL